jgi:hypothetical protein
MVERNLSLCFSPVIIDDDSILRAVNEVILGLSNIDNLCLLIGDQTHSPDLIREYFPTLTTVSLWGTPSRLSIAHLPFALSSVIHVPVLFLGSANHNRSVLWYRFDDGQFTNGEEGRDTQIELYISRGIEQTYEVSLPTKDRPTDISLDQFLPPVRGWCLRSSTPTLIPGQPLTFQNIHGILENTIPNTTFECWWNLD